MTCDYFSFFFQINWYDHHGNLVNDATYKSFRMRDSKTFEARSSIRFTPRKEHHNQTYRCEAWNEAGDNLRPALARLFVEYAPSVTVTPVRPGMIQEGDKVLILRLTYIILAKRLILCGTWSLYKVTVNYGLFCPICSKCYVRRRSSV